MTDQDPMDRALRTQLGSADLPSPDPVAALDGLRPRYERARRRRTAVRGAVASAAAAVVLVLGGLALSGRGTDELDVVDGSRPTTTAPATTTTEVPVVTGPVTSAPAPPTTAVPGVSTAPAPGSATTVVPEVAAPSPTTSVASTPSTTAAPPAQRLEVPATGGTVVVDWTPTTLSLVRVTPAAGWSETSRRTESQRIEVRFTRDGGSSGEGSGTSRVEVRLEGGVPAVVTD